MTTSASATGLCIKTRNLPAAHGEGIIPPPRFSRMNDSICPRIASFSARDRTTRFAFSNFFSSCGVNSFIFLFSFEHGPEFLQPAMDAHRNNIFRLFQNLGDVFGSESFDESHHEHSAIRFFDMPEHTQCLLPRSKRLPIRSMLVDGRESNLFQSLES